MTWKAIGQSVAGTSHIAAAKGCEDAVRYEVFSHPHGYDVLACCISDGAGSATHAAIASAFTVTKAMEYIQHFIAHGEELTEAHIYALAEDIYHGLAEEAAANELPISEYSCTIAACILTPDRSAFMQIGDGAIVRDDGNDGYNIVWWPQTGEYHNTTYFITDNSSLGDLHVMVTDTPVNEIALFTDGLQLLALNMEASSVHQPFFKDLFRYLRQADNSDKIAVLDHKLAEYLDSPRINERTDDDKTLFMATRLPA
ncbi:PP2C family serine/threonine-protein phosphatase [Nemorincola caseinilytica]|uniref:PP2C family serine/threonine-protein phosphatase n=1 Tax=Nemorincola caseinilytica TaxID=2054315 RepID=A0ABP8NMA1_9BACT